MIIPAAFASQTSAYDGSTQYDSGTSPLTHDDDEGQADLAANRLRNFDLNSKNTVNEIEATEKGDSRAVDVAAIAVNESPASISQHSATTDLRKKIAKRLCELTDRLGASRSLPQRAANLEILTRDLARCHAAFAESKSESNYLSIITHVEATFASMDWKAASSKQWKAVKDALEIGAVKDRVSFSDFDHVLRVFRDRAIPTGPTFEIGTD